MIKIIIILLYPLLATVLMTKNISIVDWQFWVVLVSVAFIDLAGYYDGAENG